MGELAGVRLWTVRTQGGKGDLIDLRFIFTVEVGPGIALYGFDKKSSDDDQGRADKAVARAQRLLKSKDGVKVVGTEASNPATASIPKKFQKLVPKDEGPARILIGRSDGKGHFFVRISIDQPKGSDSVGFNVPFDGNLPDSLKNKNFNGNAFFVTDGITDVADAIVRFRDGIVDSP